MIFRVLRFTREISKWICCLIMLKKMLLVWSCCSSCCNCRVTVCDKGNKSPSILSICDCMSFFSSLIVLESWCTLQQLPWVILMDFKCSILIMKNRWRYYDSIKYVASWFNLVSSLDGHYVEVNFWCSHTVILFSLSRILYGHFWWWNDLVP